MQRTLVAVLFYFRLQSTILGYELFPLDREIVYEYEAIVDVGAYKSLYNSHKESSNPPTSGWLARGTLKLQRRENQTIAAALAVEKVTITSGDVFYQNKEMQPLYNPFHIVLQNDLVTGVHFKDQEPKWSSNFKRAIAAALQVQGALDAGAFIASEEGLHGVCSTEYYVEAQIDRVLVQKTTNLATCSHFPGGIHVTRNNTLPNVCDPDKQHNVVTGSNGDYVFRPHKNGGHYLGSARLKSSTMVQTFGSTGEAQFINSELVLNHVRETDITTLLDISTNMSSTASSLLFVTHGKEETGDRQPSTPEELIQSTVSILNSLADSLEDMHLKFDDPYDRRVTDIIFKIAKLNNEDLAKLYKEIDVGTSYRQETVRNIFLEIIPRVGTKASVLLTKDLILKENVRPTTAVQLLVFLPFHIYELSYDLVKECEVLLNLSPDRPDVKQAAALSFATLVYQTRLANQMTDIEFDHYVKKFFDLYLSSSKNGLNFEHKMLYLQALGNLQLGNVFDYLEPIIKLEFHNTDLRFLAMFSTLNIVPTRGDKIYELYWPIFVNQSSTLEMRVTSMVLLFIASPTPERVLSVHKVMQKETCPHLINFYRTTILSITGTTYPCYKDLRKAVAYASRNLPNAPAMRYWTTGNYVFDYRDKNHGVGAMLQSILIADPNNDLPAVLYVKFDTEALGQFTGQLGVYIKARGLTDAVLERLVSYTSINPVLSDLLKSMAVPELSPTPLHLEFIVQMEGKAVLTYYLSQQTLQNLTDIEIINKINLLFRAHINMQVVRWPFMVKYSVPTVVGTPAEVSLQTAVLASLRGNITHNMIAEKMIRNNQIDIRYSSYAVCKSHSYNPFLNFEHSINREQGFLLYLPVSNEIVVNISSQVVSVSLNRPDNLTCGFSLKSRSRAFSGGFVTRNAIKPLEHEIISKRENSNANEKLNPFGLSLTFDTNFEDLFNTFMMQYKSHFEENTNVLSSLFGPILPLILAETLQLGSIHLGNNKDISILENNQQNNRIEGTFSYQVADTSDPKQKSQSHYNLLVEHFKNTDKQGTLEVRLKLSENSETEKQSGRMHLKYIPRRQPPWKICTDFSSQPFEYPARPYIFQLSSKFGNSNVTASDCAQSESRVDLTFKAGLSNKTLEMYQEQEDQLDATCSKSVLKLSPPPQTEQCNSKHLSKYTRVTECGMRTKFHNMPELFQNGLDRLDHLLAAFSLKNTQSLNLRNGFNMSATIGETLDVNINNNRYQVRNLFDFNYNSKYDTLEDLVVNSGLKRICSVIGKNLNDFNSHTTSNFYESTTGEWLLLAAECRFVSPRFAVFIKQMSADEPVYSLKVYIGSDYFEYHPNVNSTVILINGSKSVNINRLSYRHLELSGLNSFKAFVTSQGVLIIEVELLNLVIQFDGNNVLNVLVLASYKSHTCGACNPHQLILKNYFIQ